MAQLGLASRIANWWYRRTWRNRVGAALDRTKTQGMVAGRPTRTAGLKPLVESEWSLVGRNYGEYRDVLATLKKIRDYNPDASLAVWNVLRLANPGHTVEVFTSQRGADGREIVDAEGQKLVNSLAAQVGSEYGGGLDSLINVLHLTLMTQGAIAAELELSENLREVLDYCPVDPRLIDFVRDPETHKVVPVVTASGAPQRVNTNQFRYIPLDPEVDDPHGRSPMWSILEVVFFQSEVLRDLKAVMHNQGYPRLDVSVLEEIVVQNTPEILKAPGREEDFRTWVDGFLSDLQSTYNSLNPDDTFIHWDWVKVAYVGNSGGAGLDIQKVMAAIDAQIVAGLKQLPILLGRNEGATTTHATVQWQIYVAGIEALQRCTKRMIEWMHNTALRIYGRQSYARVEFDPIRKSDRKAEAESEKIEMDTLVMKVLAGWVSNDEAAQEAVGHPAVGVMQLLPGAGGSVSTGGAVEQDRARVRSTAGPQSRVLQGLTPEGVPDWLWARTRQTGLACQKWAEQTFGEKVQGYLSMEAVRDAPGHSETKVRE